MGLDGVELVMELEDHFGLAIPDKDAGHLITIGMTSKYIAERLAELPWPAGVCPTAKAFYSLRRELGAQAGVARDRVNLDSPVDELVGKGNGQSWHDIALASGLRPERGFFSRKKGPPAGMSIREVIENLHTAAGRRADGTVDEALVFEEVRLVVSEQMRVPVATLTRDTQYHKDLGIG